MAQDWGMTSESDLDASDLVRKKYPLLADTSHVIADPLSPLEFWAA